MSSKIAMVTLYTENIRRLAELTNPSKEDYCKKWGYDFVCQVGSLDPHRPAAWSKILLLRKLMDKYEWLFWLDADAMIMNREIPIERFIDDRYSMIVVKLENRDLFGDLHLNTGSFFIRADDHGREILDAIYRQNQYISHPCWEQKAFNELFIDQNNFRQRVKVDLVPTRFNAVAFNYSKGDFVFHALGPVRTEQGKMGLIKTIIDEDRQISFDNQPPLNILFQYSPSDESDLLNLTFSSLMQNQESINEDVIHMVKDIHTDFGRRVDWHQTHRETVNMICRLLDLKGDGVIVLVKPGVQFFSRWRRTLLVSLGRNDMAISIDPETRQVRDEFIIMRNNLRIQKLWCNLGTQCENATDSGNKDSLRLLLDAAIKGSGDEFTDLTWTHLPENRVFLGRPGTYQEKNILKLVVYGVLGDSDATAKCEDLTYIRRKWRNAIERLTENAIEEIRKTVISY